MKTLVVVCLVGAMCCADATKQRSFDYKFCSGSSNSDTFNNTTNQTHDKFNKTTNQTNSTHNFERFADACLWCVEFAGSCANSVVSFGRIFFEPTNSFVAALHVVALLVTSPLWFCFLTAVPMWALHWLLVKLFAIVNWLFEHNFVKMKDSAQFKKLFRELFLGFINSKVDPKSILDKLLQHRNTELLTEGRLWAILHVSLNFNRCNIQKMQEMLSYAIATLEPYKDQITTERYIDKEGFNNVPNAVTNCETVEKAIKHVELSCVTLLIRQFVEQDIQIYRHKLRREFMKLLISIVIAMTVATNLEWGGVMIMLILVGIFSKWCQRQHAWVLKRLAVATIHTYMIVNFTSGSVEDNKGDIRANISNAVNNINAVTKTQATQTFCNVNRKVYNEMQEQNSIPENFGQCHALVPEFGMLSAFVAAMENAWNFEFPTITQCFKKHKSFMTVVNSHYDWMNQQLYELVQEGWLCLEKWTLVDKLAKAGTKSQELFSAIDVVWKLAATAMLYLVWDKVGGWQDAVHQLTDLPSELGLDVILAHWPFGFRN